MWDLQQRLKSRWHPVTRAAKLTPYLPARHSAMLLPKLYITANDDATSDFCSTNDTSLYPKCTKPWQKIAGISTVRLKYGYFIFHHVPNLELLWVSVWQQPPEWNESRIKLRLLKNNFLSVGCTLIYNVLALCCVCLWVVCLYILCGGEYTLMVYTSQRLPITLIKFHTTQGDSLCPDQIANISWLKYMFAKRLERKKINRGSENTQTDCW